MRSSLRMTKIKRVPTVHLKVRPFKARVKIHARLHIPRETIVYCAPDISMNFTSSLFIFFRPSMGRYTMCPAS